MRSLFFNLFWGLGTVTYAISCVILSFIPGRAAMMGSLNRYGKVMMWAMRHIAGIKIDVRGLEHLPAPEDGPVIIAAKHQGYGDFIPMLAHVKDLSGVAGDHIMKLPLIPRILKKMSAVVVYSGGGSDVQEKMAEQARIVKEQKRRILIYPEGHLSPPGTHHRYRKGVYHMYRDFGCAVVPVAANLGQRWNQEDWVKHPGDAVIEFMEPIPPGLEKDEFMTRLQEMIEGRSLELLDLENPGALDPSQIGQLTENAGALKNRLKKEAKAKAQAAAAQAGE